MNRPLLVLAALSLSAGARAELPPLPAEVPGALVIAGGGKLPDAVRQRFLELAGKEKAKLVVIPTASASADDARQADSSLEPWRPFKPASLTLLHTRDRKTADDPAFVKPLAEATAVWLGGGDQSRLPAAYRGTAVERELNALLKRGGVIGGTSAGAAVQGDVMIEGGNPVAKAGRGFGWLPGFVVDQHFLRRNRVERLFGVLAANPGHVGLGVDEGTAAVVKGRSVRVVGDSCAVVCQAAGGGREPSMRVLRPGDEVDLFQVRRAALGRAAKTPFPPARPAEPVVENGALIIGGGGGMPADAVRRFVELAGGPDAPIVVVSTAYDDPVPAEPGEVKMLRKFGAKNVVTLHTRDRAVACKDDFCKCLKDARGVWFSGGRQWRFVDAYEGTPAEELFRGVLKRGGVIGGSSAGASIQSEYMPRGHPLGNLVMMVEGYERGFGFLPGVAVDQHFFARKRTGDMTRLMAAYPQYLGVGIDEGTVIVVRGSELEVVGRGKVAVYDRRKPVAEGKPDYEELPPGAKYDLKERERK